MTDILLKIVSLLIVFTLSVEITILLTSGFRGIVKRSMFVDKRVVRYRCFSIEYVDGGVISDEHTIFFSHIYRINGKNYFVLRWTRESRYCKELFNVDDKIKDEINSKEKVRKVSMNIIGRRIMVNKFLTGLR